MSGRKMISVCIPAYNQVEFLKRTLDSLATQTFRDFDVVITDDSTHTAVRDLVETYSGVLTLTYQHNATPLGSPKNWNMALSLATGEYIKMMHHDDWFSAAGSLMQFAKAAMRDPDSGLIFCNSEVLDTRDNTTRFSVPGSRFIESLENDPTVLFDNNLVGSPSAVMFRNTGERFDENLKYLVDVEFYIRLLSKNRKFTHINRPLIVNTSHHAGQVTASSLDRATQVGEYSYLYNKVFNGKIPDLEISRFFLQLFKTHEVESLEEIETFGFPQPQPAWYFKLLLYFGKLKNN